jgi:hypothetical protein
MTLLRAIVGGIAGAGALTLLNEGVRQILPNAPRAEVLGMRALAKSLRAADQQPPNQDELYGWALVGDILGNSLYYTFVGIGKPEGVWRRGAALGLAAGLGAAFLPGPLGIGPQPNERFPMTHALTVAWYLAGGLVAAAVVARQPKSISRV